jgi:hypothetical protein
MPPTMVGGVDDHDELPLDPDLDDLPPELASAQGPLTLVGWDKNGERIEGPIALIDLARGLADRRRVHQQTALSV